MLRRIIRQEREAGRLECLARRGRCYCWRCRLLLILKKMLELATRLG